MKGLILAAGYATRLYPLTLTKAKPLLEVAGKPMIEWVLEKMRGVPDLKTVYVVTNNKFAADFQKWAEGYMSKHPGFSLKVINDGSTSDEDKLGAIGDINHVITQEQLHNEPLLVVAGDNLFTESLGNFVAEAQRTKAVAQLATYDVGDLEAIKKYASIGTDAEGIITEFEEKPAKPKNTLAGIAIYYYSPEVVSMVTTYLAAGNNPDQPGRFLQWLHAKKPVRTYQLKGKWLDIGSKETLEEAGTLFFNALK